VVEGEFSTGTEELVLDEEAPERLVDWVSLDPAALSPVGLAVVEVSPGLPASAPLLVLEADSLPALPLEDSPPPLALLAVDAALADAWAALERAAAAREMSAMLAVTK
jgi:hypothetical protein